MPFSSAVTNQASEPRPGDAGESPQEAVIPVLRPLLPTADRLLPYLSQIDETRIYSNWGPLVGQLQERVAGELGQPHGSVVCASSGTTALVGAILGTAGRASSERPLAVLPALTFVATAFAVEQCGFTPFVADVDATTWTLDPVRLEEEIDLDAVGLVVPVAPFGRPVPQGEWQTFRARTGIPVVIDGAASFDLVGSSPQPALGDIPVTMSFHATKAFSSGEGGCIACGSSEAGIKVLRALNFGFYDDREAMSASTNGKMSEYHAAVGLAELDGWSAKRNSLERAVAAYVDAFARAGLPDRLVCPPTVGRSYLLFQARDSAESEAVQRSLRARGIGFRLWYGRGIHGHPHFAADTGARPETSDDLAARLIGLPIAPDLGPDEVSRIAEAASLGTV